MRHFISGHARNAASKAFLHFVKILAIRPFSRTRKNRPLKINYFPYLEKSPSRRDFGENFRKKIFLAENELVHFSRNFLFDRESGLNAIFSP